VTQVAPHSGRHTWQSAAGEPLRPHLAADGGWNSGEITTRRSHRAPADAPSGPAPVTPHPAPRRGRHATSYGQNFPRVVGWTLLGSLIPGVGLLAAGRRTSGTIALTLASLMASAAVTYAVIGDPANAVALLVTAPDRFLILGAALGLLLVLWAAMVVGTHSALRRYAHLSSAQRIVCSLLVTSLIALIAIPTAKAGSYALITRDTLTGIFTNTESGTAAGTRPNRANKADPWAGLPRVNVLLIGSDAGADRIGIRPDTLILASIETKSGDTVLFSLPRNLQNVPFPPGTRQAVDNPRGFRCADANGVPQCLLNAMWTFGEENWKRYYADEPTAYDAGLRATSEAVEQVTGLHVDQYAMLNLRGFMQFVDALGGVTVNVYHRLPIGGSSEHRVAREWIEPGMNQHLDGYHALWYARSRWSTDDYDRMRRQRCVIGAVIKEADPAKMALAFPEIAAAAKSNITTGIPLADLGAWVQLTQKVQKAHVRSLPFTSSVVNTENPDFPAIKHLVAEALNPPAEVTPSPAPSASTKPSGGKPSATPTPGHPTDPAEARKAQDVNAVC